VPSCWVPSTGSMAPVTKEAWSEQRHTAASAPRTGLRAAGPYPTVLGRPVSDAQAHYSLSRGSRFPHLVLEQLAAAVHASRTNGFALIG
jgi:hypothetical protein